MSSIASATNITPASDAPTVDVGSALSALGIDVAPDAHGLSAPVDAPETNEEQATAPAETPDTEDVQAAAAAEPDLFTDEALSTKEGVLAAKDAVRKMQIRSHRVHQKLERRSERAAQRELEAQQARDAHVALSRQVQADLQLARTGTADEVLAALSRLTGRSGADVYEELTNAVISNGKAPKPNPEISELRAQIERFQVMQIQAQQLARNEAIVRQRTAEIQTKVSSAPSIAHFIAAGKLDAQSVTAQIVEDMRQHFARTGQRTTEERVIAQYEKELKDLVPAVKLPAEASAAPKGTPPKAAPARLPGRGVSPGRANAASAARELSDDERMAELAADPAFMRSLGLG